MMTPVRFIATLCLIGLVLLIFLVVPPHSYPFVYGLLFIASLIFPDWIKLGGGDE